MHVNERVVIKIIHDILLNEIKMDMAENIPSSSFRKNLCRVGIISALNVWYNFSVKPLGPRVFFVIMFFNCRFISLL